MNKEIHWFWLGKQDRPFWNRVMWFLALLMALPAFLILNQKSATFSGIIEIWFGLCIGWLDIFQSLGIGSFFNCVTGILFVFLLMPLPIYFLWMVCYFALRIIFAIIRR